MSKSWPEYGNDSFIPYLHEKVLFQHIVSLVYISRISYISRKEKLLYTDLKSRGKIPHQMWIIMSFTSVNRNEKTRSYQLVFLRFCFSLYEMKCRPWECFQTFQFFVQCKIQHKRKSHPMRKKYVFNLTNLFFQTSPEKTVYFYYNVYAWNKTLSPRKSSILSHLLLDFLRWNMFSMQNS